MFASPVWIMFLPFSGISIQHQPLWNQLIKPQNGVLRLDPAPTCRNYSGCVNCGSKMLTKQLVNRCSLPKSMATRGLDPHPHQKWYGYGDMGHKNFGVMCNLDGFMIWTWAEQMRKKMRLFVAKLRTTHVQEKLLIEFNGPLTGPLPANCEKENSGLKCRCGWNLINHLW